MDDYKFRILNITIENFKNVIFGNIDLGTTSDNGSSILGLYGQNGSGKTAMIDAIDLLKCVLRGFSVPKEYCDSINVDSKYSKFKYFFELYVEGEKYEIKYEFKIGKEIFFIGNLENKEQEQERIVVFDELLSYSFEGKNKKIRMHKFIDTKTEDVFKPDTKYISIFGKNRELKSRLLSYKDIAKRNSTSFIFSNDFLSLLPKKFENKDKHDILVDCNLLSVLIHYANSSLFIIKTSNTGMISSDILPLTFRYGSITKGGCGKIKLNLEESNVLENEFYEICRKIIDNMNIVLENIIPRLKISMKNLGVEPLENGDIGKVIKIMSCRDGKEIPFKCESEGIKKIVSVLQLLISVFNDSSIVVAIDELDSGIFEYLLGEILEIISDKGKGQLIFTSHNLRPLEVLDKSFIAFTTTNPENRYFRFSNIGKNNNLRSVYFNSIVLGGQKEEIYKPTKSGKISMAFSKAGKIDE